MVQEPLRILVVQPNWVGDAVMATPALRAIREHYPHAHISYLLRRYVKAMYTGMPWANRLLTYRTGKTPLRSGGGKIIELSARLRRGKFDLAILLPNSFRSALVCKMAGIDRIAGYDRDGRGFLLSDKLMPSRDEKNKFIPKPVLKTYLGLANYLGATSSNAAMQLFVTPSEAREAADGLRTLGIADLDRPASSGGKPLIILNPGAQYGSAKCWLPSYFAALSDRFVAELGATVIVSTAPKEKRIVDEIAAHAQRPFINLAAAGLSLGALKEVIRRCDLMVTNDTGPRHIAAALGTSVVTVFGPTHQEWTTIDFDRERRIQIPVWCGPCQLKLCPLDHRCMTQLTPAMVFDQAMQLLASPVMSAS